MTPNTEKREQLTKEYLDLMEKLKELTQEEREIKMRIYHIKKELGVEWLWERL
jgi:hypothetical protein